MEKWKRQFIKMLFHYDARRLNIEGAYRVKHPHVPKSLYKYRSFSDAHKEAFLKGELWTSSADKLNDPNECGTYFRPEAMIVEDLTLEEKQSRIAKLEKDSSKINEYYALPISKPITSGEHFQKIMDEAFNKQPHEHEEVIRSIFKKMAIESNEKLMNEMSAGMRRHVGVLSLSATYESTLMWAHYANSHKGFTLEYDFGALEYNDIRRRSCFPVFYSRKRRDLTNHMIKQPGSERFNNLFGQFIALVKQEEWAYEKEWRIISMIGSPYATLPMQMPKPKSVILGKNCSLCDQDWMLEKCSVKGIAVNKMKASDRQGYSALESLLKSS